MSDNMNSEIIDTSKTLPGLSKKDKGRWKKLRKRAANKSGDVGVATTNTSTSGLTSREDWIALQEFHNKLVSGCDDGETPILLPFGPSVCLRKGKTQSGLEQVAEGEHHRDLLANILLGDHGTSKKQKKRARDDDDDKVALDSFSFPAWAILHNPICLEHVAVIIVHVENKAAHQCLGWEQVFHGLPAVDQLSSHHSVVKTQTRWFQGPSPKSITDSLLYLRRDNKMASIQSNEQVTEMHQLVPLMEDLILSSAGLLSEGYPLIDSTTIEQTPTGGLNTLSCLETGRYQIPSLAEAKAVVNSCKVDCVLNIECESNDRSLPSFVTTVSHHVQESMTTAATPRILALDCEMVKTTKGTELARATLVQLTLWEQAGGDDDNNNNTKINLITESLLDEWVKPYGTVLDYLTEYSGATATILKQATTGLEQIQAALLQLIDRNDILIGHSLDNDLKAARMVHNRVVDTSVLFRVGRRGCKFSLRHLAATLLKRRIQTGDHHCSEEDAVTAMHLAVQRARLGPAFGIRNRAMIPILDTFASQGVTVAIGPPTWLQEHVTKQPNGVHALACESVVDGNSKAISAWLTGPKRRARLVLSNLVVCNEPDLVNLNKLLADLTKGMSPRTLILLAFQRGLTRAMDLSRRRKACQDPRSTVGWNEEEEKNWKHVVEECRYGPAIWIGASNLEASTNGS